MNKIRQYICAFLAIFMFLLPPAVFADETSTSNSEANEPRKDCTQEVRPKVAAQFKNDVAAMNSAIESWHASVKELDITCQSYIKDKQCNGTYINTDGTIENVLEGKSGAQYKADLKEWNEINWTDHDYECAQRIASQNGNSKCAKITGEMIEKRKTLEEIYNKLSHEAAILTTGAKVTCSDNNCENPTECSAVDSSGVALEGASKGCKPIMEKISENEACPLCKIFKIILDTDQNIATKSYGALAHPFRNVIIMVMGLYIAYQTLLMVGAFTKQDAPKYITTLLVQAFKVGIAALLLTESSYIYNNVINPLMKGGMEFGEALLFSERAGELKIDSGKWGEFDEGAIGTDVLRKIMETVMAFNKKAATMPSIGSSLICISVHEAASFLIDFSMFTQGLLLYAFGWMILLSASFYLLDLTVRFGIFCALVPFLIAAWPLKVTRSYTMNGWKIFINSFFNFAMMGLVLSVCLELVSEALGGGSEELIAAINGNSVETLQKMMDMSGTSFLKTLVCCMFAFKMVKEVGALASEISGTSGGSQIGASIGGTAANVAKRTAGTAAKIGGKVTGATSAIHKAQEKLGLREPSPASKLPQAPNPSGGGASGNSGGSGDSGNGGSSGNTQTNSNGGAQGQNTQGGNSDAAQGGTGASGASENASGGNAGDSTDGSNQGGA